MGLGCIWINVYVAACEFQMGYDSEMYLICQRIKIIFQSAM